MVLSSLVGHRSYWVPGSGGYLWYRQDPITFFMGYSQKTTLVVRVNTQLYFETPLGRNEIIINIFGRAYK
jgi:hypothetical protein